jgi:hypothetical protein
MALNPYFHVLYTSITPSMVLLNQPLLAGHAVHIPCFVAKHDDPRHLLAIRIRFLFMRSQVLQNYKIIYHLNKHRVSLAPEREQLWLFTSEFWCTAAALLPHGTARHGTKRLSAYTRMRARQAHGCMHLQILFQPSELLLVGERLGGPEICKCV